MTDIFLCSPHLHTWYCVDIARRNSVLVMGVQGLSGFQTYQAICYVFHKVLRTLYKLYKFVSNLRKEYQTTATKLHCKQLFSPKCCCLPHHVLYWYAGFSKIAIGYSQNFLNYQDLKLQIRVKPQGCQETICLQGMKHNHQLTAKMIQQLLRWQIMS